MVEPMLSQYFVEKTTLSGIITTTTWEAMKVYLKAWATH